MSSVTVSNFSDQFPPSVQPHNLVTGFHLPRQQWSLLNHFTHRTGTLRCLQKEMAIYRHWSVSLRWDPDDAAHRRILSSDKTEWRLIPAAHCRWRCCFLTDQLWFMTCIREEEVTAYSELSRLWISSHMWLIVCLEWDVKLSSVELKICL